MRRILINYADGEFYYPHQNKNSITAINTNSIDEVFQYRPGNIEKGFYERNREILQQPRGRGYWLWKPYFVKRTLDVLQDGDFVFYSDSRVEFLKNIQPLYDLNNQTEHGITAFQLNSPCTETRNTKRYTFQYMDCDDPRYYTGNNELQNLASFFLIRKTPQSTSFIFEWLRYAQDFDNISDSSCKDNFPNFMDHRHDQSIFSLLLKKNNIETYIDPSQYGNPRRPLDYPFDQLLLHTR